MNCKHETQALRWIMGRNPPAKELIAPAQALSTCLQNVGDSPIDPRLPVDLAESSNFPASRGALFSLLDYVDQTVNTRADTPLPPAMGQEIVKQAAMMVGTTVLTNIFLSALGGKL